MNIKKKIRTYLERFHTTYVKVVSVEEPNLFMGKNVMITGGSSGIGLEIAKKVVRGDYSSQEGM